MIDFAALDRRISERAHKIWEEEGEPEGRAEAHWDMAREQIAIEDNQGFATKPNPLAEGREYADQMDTAEPIEAVENQVGDMPGRSDQGEGHPYPSRDNLHELNES